MSRRKDAERFSRLKEQNPDYVGYRGAKTAPARPAPSLETVVCSVCNRRRNVDSHSLPADRSAYVCLSCEEEQTPAPTGVAQ